MISGAVEIRLWNTTSLYAVVWQVKDVDKQPALAKEATRKGSHKAEHEQVHYNHSACICRVKALQDHFPSCRLHGLCSAHPCVIVPFAAAQDSEEGWEDRGDPEDRKDVTRPPIPQRPTRPGDGGGVRLLADGPVFVVNHDPPPRTLHEMENVRDAGSHVARRRAQSRSQQAGAAGS